MNYVGRIVTFRNKAVVSYGAEIFDSDEAMAAGTPAAFGKGHTPEIARRHAGADLTLLTGASQVVRWLDTEG